MDIEIYILLGIIIGIILGTSFCVLVFLIVSKNKAKVSNLVDHLELPHGKAQFIESINKEKEWLEADSLKVLK